MREQIAAIKDLSQKEKDKSLLDKMQISIFELLIEPKNVSSFRTVQPSLMNPVTGQEREIVV